MVGSIRPKAGLHALLVNIYKLNTVTSSVQCPSGSLVSFSVGEGE